MANHRGPLSIGPNTGKLFQEERERFSWDDFRNVTAGKFKVNENGCWVWLPTPSTKYPVCWLPSVSRRLLLHRVSYELYRGVTISHKKYACHSCDERRCINPTHIFAGTPKDNTRDMMEKRRNVFYKGEKHGSAKLSRKEAIEIIARYKSGEKIYHIAKDFNVTGQAISYIAQGRRWKHLHAELEPKDKD